MSPKLPVVTTKTSMKIDGNQKLTVVGSIPNSLFHIPRLLPLETEDAEIGRVDVLLLKFKAR